MESPRQSEADTCRRFVVPNLQRAGWDTDPHQIREQVTFTDGRIVVTGQNGVRRPGKRADYVLRYSPDLWGQTEPTSGADSFKRLACRIIRATAARIPRLAP